MIQKGYPKSFSYYGLDQQASPNGSEQETEMFPTSQIHRLQKIWNFPESLVLFLHAVLNHVLWSSKPPSPIPVEHLTSSFRAKAGSVISTTYLALQDGD